MREMRRLAGAADMDRARSPLPVINGAFVPPVSSPTNVSAWLGFWHAARNDPSLRAINRAIYQEYRTLMTGSSGEPPRSSARRPSTDEVVSTLMALMDGAWIEAGHRFELDEGGGVVAGLRSHGPGRLSPLQSGRPATGGPQRRPHARESAGALTTVGLPAEGDQRRVAGRREHRHLAAVNASGGRTLSTLPPAAARADQHAALAQGVLDRAGHGGVGSLVAGSVTISMPLARPDAATSPTDGWRGGHVADAPRSASPAIADPRAAPARRSSTSSTARRRPPRHRLPPKVEKKTVSSANRSAISRRVMTAATGWPLPIGLPRVTKSGSMPNRWNDHIASPVRPWPPCTSSAIHSPPAAWVRRTSVCDVAPGRGRRTPSLCSTPSRIAAAGAMPRAASRSQRRRERRRSRGASPVARPAGRQRSTCVAAGRPPGQVSGRQRRRSPRRCRGRRSAVHRPPRCPVTCVASRQARSLASEPGVDEEHRVEPGRAGRDQPLGELDRRPRAGSACWC